MEFECGLCDRKFVSEESLKQHQDVKHPRDTKKKINYRKYIIFSLLGLIIILSIITIYSYSQKSGNFDDFAKCLTEKGAIVYGNDFCSYTNKQLNFFGKSEKYLNYVKCFDNQEVCDSKGVQTTPTWEIKGKMYAQVQTFESLSALTGCEV